MAAKDDPVIDLVEEEEEEWPEVGAQNPEEAERYTERINNVFDHLSELIHQDTKTALGQTIQNFKKIVVRQWAAMGDTDVDVVLKTIKDPTAMYLWQHLTGGGVKVVDPPNRTGVFTAATRKGQAGRGKSVHCRHLQPCSTGTRAPVGGLCQCKFPRKSYRQGHPAVSDKRSCPPACTAQHPQGVFEPR